MTSARKVRSSSNVSAVFFTTSKVSASVAPGPIAPRSQTYTLAVAGRSVGSLSSAWRAGFWSRNNPRAQFEQPSLREGEVGEIVIGVMATVVRELNRKAKWVARTGQNKEQLAPHHVDVEVFGLRYPATGLILPIHAATSGFFASRFATVTAPTRKRSRSPGRKRRRAREHSPRQARRWSCRRRHRP
jgi:hypothetical protein